MDRRRFLYLTGLAALATGCGSNSTDSAIVAPAGNSPSLVAERFGRGARRSTPEQIANAFQALDPFVAEGSSVSMKTSVPSKAMLPAAILAPVQDQGPLESCGSFGIGYSLSAGMAAIANPGMQLSSPANQPSSAYIYKVAYTAEGVPNALADQSGADSGTYGTDYFNQLITGGGNTTWADVAYPSYTLGEDKMCAALDQIQLPAAQIDSRFALGGWKYFSSLDTLKSHIAKGIPVACLVECYENFDDSFKDPNGTKVFEGQGKPNDGGHFMCIIGYDDTMGPNGAILLQNSWGAEFGHNGLVWFDTKSFMASLEYFYVGNPVSSGGTGTALTNTGAGGSAALRGTVTKAHQVDEGHSVHLVFFLELSRPVELTAMHLVGPGGPRRISFRHRSPFRSGYLYASRKDQLQFQPGDYKLELDTSEGHHLEAAVAIPPLDGRKGGELVVDITANGVPSFTATG